MLITKTELKTMIKDEISYLQPRRVSYELTLNEALLNEGLAPGIIKDVVQYVAAAGGEYGLGALTMPAAGAGVAVGPAVETAVDAAFGAGAIKSAVESAYTFGKKLNEFAELWDAAMDAWDAQDFDTYYDTLVNLVREALPLLGDQAGEAVDKMAEKLRNLVEKALNSLLDTIEGAIKMVIPDATVGLAVSKAVTTAITSVAERPFDVASTVIGKVSILRKFIADPAIAVDFFKDILTQIIDLMRQASEKLEDVSWKKTFLATMAIGASGVGAIAAPNILALRALGPLGLAKVADLMEKQLPMILDVIEKILVVLIPLVLNALALYQILLSGEYKGEGEGKAKLATTADDALAISAKEKGKAKGKAKGEVPTIGTADARMSLQERERNTRKMKITTSHLKRIIQEETQAVLLEFRISR